MVPIHPKIQPIIDAWASRGCQALYCDEKGKPYNRDSFRTKVWNPAIRALGLPDDLTPHSARHMLIEKSNDHEKYPYIATQNDIEKFFK